MGLDLVNLDTETRTHMAAELDGDIAGRRLYYSKHFTETGRQRYPDLLREAMRSGSDESLAATLSTPDMFVSTYERRKPNGGVAVAAVPRTAPVTFAEGEFNRFYLRGLCCRTIALGGEHIEIYRARPSAHPRAESEALVGHLLEASALLNDLRTHPGVDTALRLPPGPNSGLSGRLARSVASLGAERHAA